MYEMVKWYGKVLTNTIMKNFDGLTFVKNEHQTPAESIKWTCFSANRKNYIIAKSRWFPKTFDGSAEQDSDHSGCFLISSGDNDIVNVKFKLLITRTSSKLVFKVHFPEINNCEHSHCLFIMNRSTEIYTMLPAYEFSNELKFEYHVDCKEETFEVDKNGFLSLEVYLYLILRKTGSQEPAQKILKNLTRKRSIADDPSIHEPVLEFKKRTIPRKNPIIDDSGSDDSSQEPVQKILKSSTRKRSFAGDPSIHEPVLEFEKRTTPRKNPIISDSGPDELLQEISSMPRKKLIFNGSSQNVVRKRSLFEDRLFPDVVFEVGRTKIKAHKGVLANASRVFLKMFQSSKDVIKIKDIEPNTLVDLFNYIYTNKFETFEEESRIKNLLIAAKKFEIEELVTINSYLLCKFIRIDNAASYLQLAKEYGFQIVRTCAVQLISTEFEEKQLTSMDSALLTEVLLMTRSKIKDEPKI